MALTYTNECLSDVLKLKKSNCGFVPSELVAVIGLKKGLRFNKTTDTLDDATISNLVKCSEWFSFDFITNADNSTEAPTEDFDGRSKLAGESTIDYDLTLACLSTCEMLQFGKIRGGYDVAFVVKGDKGEKKLMFAVAESGELKGFSTNLFGQKSRTFGSASAVNKLIMRLQLDESGSNDFIRNFDFIDLDIDLENYNVGGANLIETSAPSLVGTDLTLQYKVVDSCNGIEAVENIASDGFAIEDANGVKITGTATEQASPNLGTYDITFAGVVSGTYDVILCDLATGKNIVKVDDCFFSATPDTIAV